MFHTRLYIFFFLVVSLIACISSEGVDTGKLDEIVKSDNDTGQIFWTFCSEPEEEENGVNGHKKKIDQQKDITTITHTIKKSSKEAEVLKLSFIRNVMNAIPDTLEAGLDEWLPKVPQFFSIGSFNAASEWGELQSIALNLTSYANIIQDIVNQTMSYEPGIQQRFQRLRNRLYFLLCKMREGFNINPIVKSASNDTQVTRTPEGKSKWNMSVYLVLRDYIKLLNHLLQLLINLSSSDEETVASDQVDNHRIINHNTNNAGDNEPHGH